MVYQWSSEHSLVQKHVYFASGGVDEFVPHMKNFWFSFHLQAFGMSGKGFVQWQWHLDGRRTGGVLVRCFRF